LRGTPGGGFCSGHLLVARRIPAELDNTLDKADPAANFGRVAANML